jgi:hypothetical protein
LSAVENNYIGNIDEIRKPLTLREPMTWMERGTCRNAPQDQFFPEKTFGGNQYKKVIETYCNVCPVKKSCLNFALDNYELGIWGGTTTRARIAIRAKMVKERKAQCQQ